MDVGVSGLLGLPDAVAAGEDDIGLRRAIRAPADTSSGGANLKFESSSMQSYTVRAAARWREKGSIIGV